MMSSSVFSNFFLLSIIFFQSLRIGFGQTFTSNAGGAIPDNGTACFDLSVNGVGNLNMSYGLVSVCLDITHTFTADLDIYLITPWGVSIELSTDNGGAGDNYQGTCFQMGFNSIITGFAPFIGTYQPEGNLNAANTGNNGNGIWQLCITDDNPGETGALNWWSLTFGNNPPGQPAPPPCIGNPPAGNTCASSTPICDFNGYCGNTSGSYTSNSWSQLSSAFCGSLENNSFLLFVATQPTVSFTVWVSNCSGNGIQFMFFSANNCSGPVQNFGCYNQIQPNQSPFTVTGTGFTPGQQYYLMIDGYAGAVCNYVIGNGQGVALPVNASAANTILCEGGSTTLTAAGGNGTYNWTPATGLSATTGATVTASPTTTTTYTVSSPSLNPFCPAFEDEVTITVNPVPPPPTVSSNSPVCVAMGQNIQLNATPPPGGPYNYYWTGPNGFSSSQQNPTIPASGSNQSGTYNGYTIANGCTSQVASTNVLVDMLSATATVNNVTCHGLANGTATLTGQNGQGQLGYLWMPGFVFNQNLGPVGPGTYTGYVIDQQACTSQVQVTITQPPPLNATSNITPVTCHGLANGSATITATGGTGTYSYAWTPSGGPGNTSSNLAANNYTVTVTDQNNCTTSVNFSITQPPPLQLTPGTVTPVSCFGGSNGAASVTATGGTGAYQYSWSPAGGNQASASNLPANNYTVTVTDANNCQTSIPINITQPPPLTAVISALTQVGCFGANTGSATVSASGGTGSYAYSWAPAGGNQPTASGLSANTYTVTVTDQNGCQTQASATITQPPPLTVSVTTQNAACNGSPTGSATSQVNGGTPQYSYNWSNGGGTNPNLVNVPANTYVLTVTDANGCTATATANIGQPSPLQATLSSITNVTCHNGSNGGATVTASGGPGGFNYLWQPGGLTGPTQSGLSPNTYTIWVYDNLNCDTVVLTLQLANPAPVQLTLSASDSTLCNGQSATLTASGVATCQWSPTASLNTATGLQVTATPAVSTMYVATGADANGCSATDSLLITVFPQPTAQINAPTQVCQGAAFSLSANSSSIPAPGILSDYEWDLNGDGNPDNQDVTLTHSFSATGSQTLSLWVTSADGCTDQATAVVFVNPTPVADFSFTAGCQSLPASFTNTSTPAASITSVLWNFGDGNTGSGNNPSHTYASPGQYNVTLVVGTAAGCADTLTQALNIWLNPIISFIAEVQCFNAVIFKASADSGNIGTFDWNFGDGQSAQGDSLMYVYDQPGVYNVTLTGTELNGCTAELSQTVTVEATLSLDQFEIPNVITPNGDGLNDILDIGGTFGACQDYQVQIFNRWGQLVYEYQKGAQGFSGQTKSGVALHPGTYFLVMRSGAIQKNSTLTLLRP
ncbi:MAG: PKD domain-containing protein [Flavobacteriales bacterium]|nr:PKD domain-containing protein [Flavobacteriales bacterium]MDW8431819.1 PKD domain-containing protein [Flavobacteriales bacterium]